MPFAYYEQLTSGEQDVYRRSDGVVAIRLPAPRELRPLVDALGAALTEGDLLSVRQTARALAAAITGMLGVAPVEVEILEHRPRASWGELHGLYTHPEGARPRIRLWLRTAHHGRVVAFRTFLRTLLHELCHHLDYALLGLPHSFHTEGFFKRESSLMNQLAPRRGNSAARRVRRRAR